MTSECDGPKRSGTFLWSNSLDCVTMTRICSVGLKEGCVSVYQPSRRGGRLMPGVKAER